MLIETQYLPSIPFFSALSKSSSITLEQFENFGKQSFRNRTQILSSQGIQNLVIPVHNANSKILTKEITIDYTQKWQLLHLRAIRSAYGKAPFFEHYFPMIEKVLLSNQIHLWDLNLNFLQVLLSCLKINKSILFSDEYIKTPSPEILDLRNVIHPKKNIHEHDYFKDYVHKKYFQVFGEQFVPELSIIDLLMNEGPQAKAYL